METPWARFVGRAIATRPTRASAPVSPSTFGAHTVRADRGAGREACELWAHLQRAPSQYSNDPYTGLR